MFSYNSGQRLPKLGEVYQWWSLEPKGRLVIEFFSSLGKITPSLDDTPIEQLQLPEYGPVEHINPDACPDDRFMDGNNEILLDIDFTQISDLQVPRDSSGLPPDLVGTLCLNRVFTESWEAADLKFALTGIDYLSNLENTRRTALREAAQRLCITEHTWRDVLFENREATSWICSIHQQENQIEVYYSTLYVDLRVWTMLKELRAEPFSKPDVIAMLNTLFPPVAKHLPSRRISQKVLHKYRNTFYRYVISVENNGKSVLDGFIERLSHPNTSHTWPNTRQNLKDYLALTDSMIKQANAVQGIDFFQNRPDDELFPRSRQNSGATMRSHTSENISFTSSANTSYDESKHSSNKSGGPKEILSNNSYEIKTTTLDNAGSESSVPFPKFVSIPRHKITGRLLYSSPKTALQEDVDALIRGAIPSPWYSSPNRSSSTSVETSKGSGSLALRLENPKFSRPNTPSLEQPHIYPRSSACTKGTSYDFHPALPGTPELPSPPQTGGKSDGSRTTAMFQKTIPSHNVTFLPELREVYTPKVKKSAFNFFRKKKKAVEIPGSESNEHIMAVYETGSARSRGKGKSMDCPRLPNEELIFAPPRPAIKKKSSFSFLHGQKSSDDARTASDSNSERTITNGLAPPRFNLRTRASLNSLFKDKKIVSNSNSLESGDDREYHHLVGAAIPQRQLTLRKARSQVSVKSTYSPKSTDGVINTPVLKKPSIFHEDRVITSADISEPFPFGSFVQPQSPAMLYEDTEDYKQIEEIRRKTLEKARKDRMERWGESEIFMRKIESAREKRRREMRDEMEREGQRIKTPASRTKEVRGRIWEENKDEGKGKERTKDTQIPAKSSPKSPNSQNSSTGKPPKTPLKARIIRELASAYSPTA